LLTAQPSFHPRLAHCYRDWVQRRQLRIRRRSDQDHSPRGKPGKLRVLPQRRFSLRTFRKRCWRSSFAKTSHCLNRSIVPLLLSTRQRQNGQAEVGNASQKASHTRFCIFPHNNAPDFLQYISGNQIRERSKQMKV
jgi:hypothetical protein